MRAALACLVAATGGCNLVFDLKETALRGPDAAIDGPGCSDGMFGIPAALPGLGPVDSPFEPQLRHDLLEVWFILAAGSDWTISRASRPDVISPFGAPELMLSGPFSYRSPALTDDGLQLFYAGSDTGLSQIYMKSRPTLDAPFGPPTLLLGLGDVSTYSFDVSFDGDTIYYTDADVLYAAPRTEALIGDGVPIADAVQYFSVSPDGLELFYNPVGVSSIERRVRTSLGAMFPTTGTLILDRGDDPDLAPDGRTLVIGANGTLVTMRRDCP